MSLIRCPLHEAAEISPRQPALLREGLSLSYSEYDTWVTLVAERLKARGCKEGTRVGIFLQTDWMYPVLIMAIIRLGAVACPLNIRWPREVLKAALTRIQCGFLLAHSRDGEPEKEMWGLHVLDAQHLFQVDTKAKPPSQGRQKVDLNKFATILFTSGSSGTSKAVVHTYGNHYYSAKGSNANIRVHSGDRWLLSLPLFHVSGLSILFRSILGGGAVVLPKTGQSLVEAAELFRISHLSMVPMQLRKFLDAEPGLDIKKRLRGVLGGGAPFPDELIQKARLQSIPLFTSYGLTEMCSQVTTTKMDTPPSERMSAGKALKYREISTDEQGELLVRGDTLFAGYVEGDDVVRPSRDDGWFATGDLGNLDEEGYLRITGRKDNMFISGGENIHPETIELVLNTMPGVKRSLVVPVPDVELGGKPVAFLEYEETGKPSQNEMKAFLEIKLDRFLHPVAMHEWPTELTQGESKPSRPVFKKRAEDLQRALER